MSAGIEATSPGFMTTLARATPVSRSSTFHQISSESCTNHSTRSLPWMMGRMYSSVVAVEAVLAGRGHRGVPRHVRAGEVGEQAEGADFVLEALLSVDLRLVLRHVQEVAVDREAAPVGADLLVSRNAYHPLGRDPV